ncbi:uncharacterized protein LOC109861576 [Pseudomyrmex gracilis]|uniref:uncharacterized protein LOC109861576 n=1 Tax=Pseudomyrmex gracilis TaxID=219809 RepID=UPI0009950306|nr:uncharacterized protein LOC109861576 [Pseudomyrmex gracilis]
MKESSITTKLQVVFNASAPTTTSLSLNDIQMVLLEPLQRVFQRILWRECSSNLVDTYELRTVTYRMASSAFLAIRCLFSLTKKYQESFPKAANAIRISPSHVEAVQLIIDVTRILALGCFELRKWISNNAEVLETIGRSGDNHQFINLYETETTKTLGLSWSSSKDELIYRVTLNSHLGPATKRSDEPLPPELQSKWALFVNELTLLNDLRVPRQVCCTSPQVEIHGFADASELAYGGCVYVRSTDKALTVSVRLLCAKSRVAPLKPLTIPKSELSAAHVLVSLVSKITSSLDVKIDSVHYWRNSVICLSWIRLEPHRLYVFVRNWASDIQAQSHPGSWKYVPSSDNPADVLSRGASPRMLSQSRLWWHGPAWLRESESHWPSQIDRVPTELPKLRDATLNILHVATTKCIISFERYSTLERLERVVAFCIKFINIQVHKLPIKGFLSAQEVWHATIVLVRLSQQESVLEEYSALSAGKDISARSKILGLKPFLHTDKTIQVGDRLGRSEFGFDKKHPMIFLSKHHLTKLLFQSEHKRLLHAGPQLLMSHVRETKPKPIAPQMADLPLDRVTPISVFYSTGVDYAGPFVTKDRKGRGCKTYKSYICLFICMATKAIHLELVSDLTTENFILALRRFVGRRGRPAKISSENGTNFVGAHSELQRLGEFLKENEGQLQDRLVTEKINWSFIPSYSPHFGGIWKARVKSTKHHLKRVVGNALLTFVEEFYSLLVQIESVLNSRPLLLMSFHSMDLQPLAPAHFITGSSLTTIPCPDMTDIPETRLSRYQKIQQMQQNFWKRWSKESVSELQCRTKWKTSVGTLKVDDLVLVKEDNLPRAAVIS